MCLSLMVGLGVCTGGSWWELSMCVILTGAAFVLIHVWFGLQVSFTFCGAWSFSSASGAGGSPQDYLENGKICSV